MKVELCVERKHSEKTDKDYTVISVKFEDGKVVYCFDERLKQVVLERMFLGQK